jgi:hypothetical protein
VVGVKDGGYDHLSIFPSILMFLHSAASFWFGSFFSTWYPVNVWADWRVIAFERLIELYGLNGLMSATMRSEGKKRSAVHALEALDTL